MNRLLLELPDRRESRCGHPRVTVERTCEKRRVSGCGAEHVHQVDTPADRGYRVAVGHRLAHRGQVGHYASYRLVATQAVTEASDDLGKYEDAHIRLYEPPQTLTDSLRDLERIGVHVDG